MLPPTPTERLAYVKVITKPNSDTPKRIILSESLEEIKLSDENKADERNTPLGSTANTDTFDIIANDIVLIADRYITTSTFLINGKKILFDNNVRSIYNDKILPNSNIISSAGDTHIYELPISTALKVGGDIVDLNRLRAGMNNLRDLFFLGLISSFDNIISRIIKMIILKNPDAISIEEKNISYGDLLKFGTIEDAKSRIIEREVVLVMRSSHAEQISWIESKTKLKNIKESNLWCAYIEVFERRNIIVHNNSIVNDRYINICSANNYDISQVSLGADLHISANYLKSSCDMLIEFGIKLIFSVWRKISKDEIEKAIDLIGNIAYDFIVTEHFQISINLLKFVLEENSLKIKDIDRRRLIINYANAIKLNGNKEEALKIVNKEDWSACDMPFHICISAIKDDDNGVIDMIETAHKADKLSASDFRNWPVFKQIRNNKAFIDKFEEIYGEKIFTTTRSTINETAKENSNPSVIPSP